MSIWKNFSRDEFKCKCGCGVGVVDAELLSVLEDLRAHFKSPVIVTSGYRCASHNKKIGGRPRSAHLLGTAADIIVKGVATSVVNDYLNRKHNNVYGIGLSNSFVHIDTRDRKSRWTY